MNKEEILELLRAWHKVGVKKAAWGNRGTEAAIHRCISDLRLLAEQHEIFISPEEITAEEQIQQVDYATAFKEWEEEFVCEECGNHGTNNFIYQRTVANCEVWGCKNCKTELLVTNMPKDE